MNNVFFTGLLQAAKSDKMQFIAIAFCAVALVFYCGFKIIAFYKAREASNNSVFFILHIPTSTIIKTFSSVGECRDYYEKNYADDPDYDWVGYDHLSKRVCIGSLGEFTCN